jgi:hypothetical protein
MSSTPIRENQSYGLFRSAWAGLEPLWLVYWVYGVLGSNILGYGFEKLGEVLPAYAALLLLVPIAAFYVWLNVAIWRCAANSSPVWCFLARGSVVLTILIIPWSLWSGFSEGT